MENAVLKSCVLGLSGGIDSALTAVIAAEAVGRNNVPRGRNAHAILLAAQCGRCGALARNLGIRYLKIPIQESFQPFSAR